VKNIGGSLTTYTYSVENKMVGITYPDSSLNTFSYDGDGKRLQKQDSTGTLRMVFDHQGPTGLYDLAKETDGSNTLVAFYTQGPMLISQRRGGNSYWYQDDALGSTSAITSSDETVTSTYKFYAFGDVLTSTGTLTNAFKYVGGLGYYSDPDSGLLLLRARFYWPGIARFLTMDPLREGTNWYGYVQNGPVGRVDPEGLRGWNFTPIQGTFCFAGWCITYSTEVVACQDGCGQWRSREYHQLCLGPGFGWGFGLHLPGLFPGGGGGIGAGGGVLLNRCTRPEQVAGFSVCCGASVSIGWAQVCFSPSSGVVTLTWGIGPGGATVTCQGCLTW
jgi:RHS repeat-associated protein